MNKKSLCSRQIAAFIAMGASVAVLLQFSPAAMAASGDPLPRCSANAQSFYLMRYAKPPYIGVNPNGDPPKTTLELATVPASGAVTATQIWSGAAAPPSSWREIALSPHTSPQPAGATVAGGMGKDGYIYALRASEGENAWDTTPAAGWSAADGRGYRSYTRNLELLRYGRDGVDNLGIVEGLGTYYWPTAGDTSTIVLGAVNGALGYQLGPNFNAADINPVDGLMYLATFQSGGVLNEVYKIDVTQTPPAYVGKITLSSPIPGAQSGDFAIDATGTYAYGIAKANGTFGN